MVVELHCVQEHNKIRVRIAAYINDTGKRYTDVYNNDWNCRFSRDLRGVGKKFQVPDENVKVLSTKNDVYFYSVSAKNIVEILNNDEEIDKIYETSRECVICLDRNSEIIFVPCGHLCSCRNCASALQKCCICRSHIVQQVTK